MNREKIDILNRQPFVDRLITIVRLIADSGKGCTFSINGKWGSGKSFALRMFEEQLSLFQDPAAAGDRYVLFHYNCWQYDFYEEPAIAIVAAIRNEISKHNSLLPELPDNVRAALSIAKEAGKELLSGFLETKFGCNPIVYLDQIKAKKEGIERNDAEENKFDTYYDFKKMLDKTKQQLSSIAEDKPVVLVVDELDRCTPDYAIKILERLHHLFDENSNIIVILAIDQQQLYRTVQQIFGSDSPGKAEIVCAEYLKKFIKFSLELDSGDISENFWERYAYILEGYRTTEEDTWLNELPIKLFQNLDVRTQELALERMQTLHSMSFGDDNSMAVLYFELIYQAISAREPKIRNFNWFVRIKRQESTHMREVLGTSLWEYLKTLVDNADGGTTKTINNKSGRVLCKNNLGIALWLFATLAETPNQYGICNGYILDDADEFNTLIEKARIYHELAQIIV